MIRSYRGSGEQRRLLRLDVDAREAVLSGELAGDVEALAGAWALAGEDEVAGLPRLPPEVELDG
jgi:hypothetical protein